MATRDLALGSLGQKQEYGFLHNHDFILSQNHELGNGQGLDLGQSRTHDALGVQHGEEHELGLSDRRGNDLGLAHGHGHHLTISQIDENDVTPLQTHSREYDQEDRYSHEDEEETNLGKDGQVADKENVEEHDQQLDVSEQNNRSETHDFDGALESLVNPSEEEASIVPSSEFEIQEPEYIFSSPPVVQSRALVPAPDHELHVGQEFPDVQSCRRALRNTAIALRFEIQTVKSDKTR